MKKVLGIVFFLFGLFCALSVIGNVLRLITGTTVKSNYDKTILISAILLCVVFGFIFFKYGLKWVIQKKKPIEKIEDIGKQ